MLSSNCITDNYEFLEYLSHDGRASTRFNGIFLTLICFFLFVFYYPAALSNFFFLTSTSSWTHPATRTVSAFWRGSSTADKKQQYFVRASREKKKHNNNILYCERESEKKKRAGNLGIPKIKLFFFRPFSLSLPCKIFACCRWRRVHVRPNSFCVELMPRATSSTIRFAHPAI